MASATLKSVARCSLAPKVPFIGCENTVFTIHHQKSLLGHVEVMPKGPIRSFVSVYTVREEAFSVAERARDGWIHNGMWPSGDVEIDAHTLSILEEDLLKRGLWMKLFSKGLILNGIRAPRHDMESYVPYLDSLLELD